MPENPPASRASRDQRALIDAAWKQFEEFRSTAASGSGGRTAPSRPLGPRLAGPDAIAGYEIESEIHRGGQGVVYLAVQRSTHRRVAIKVMREGPFAGPRERVRFEREVQILAQLRHPNIVTIHDSGLSGAAAYFVMDYIDGEPLDRHWERSDISLRQRLELFAKICGAVNAAHLRGVIHRDLKPGNIRIDRAAEPHILDFGLAKNSVDDDTANLTLTGQFVGSLPWASPEQAEGRLDDVDLRTDVYALGVMLYQLLTARFPYKVSGSLRETTDSIVNSSPVNPREHNRELDGDITTIVLKCLSKHRDGRYQSAGELERDLQRYLRGEPIEARRDSLSYTIRKQLQRHKLAAGVSLAFALVVIASLAVSLTLWRQAERAKLAERAQKQIALDNEQQAREQAELARQNEQRAREQTELALDNADLARQQADRAEATSRFLEQILTAASPFEGGGREVTVVEALAAAEKRLDSGELEGRGDLEAEVRRVIGKTYGGLGLFEEARVQLSAALEQMLEHYPAESPTVLMVQCELGEILRAAEDTAGAEALLRETIEVCRRTGEEGTLATSLTHLGALLREQGQLAAAEPLLAEAEQLQRRLAPPPSVACADAVNNLALLYQDQNRLAETERLLQDARAQYEAVGGRRDTRTATVLSNLANLAAQRGELAAAESLYRESLATLTEIHGPDHDEVGSVRANLGVLLMQTGRAEEAEAELREALRVAEHTFGRGHHGTAGALISLGAVIYHRGRTLESAETFERALTALESAAGGDTPMVLSLLNNLGAIRATLGDYAAAAEYLRRAYEGRIATNGPDHQETIAVASNYAQALQGIDEDAEGERILRQVVEVRRAINDPHLADSLSLLAQACTNLGRLDDARRLFEESLALHGDDSAERALILAGLGQIAFADDNLEEAAQLYCEATRLAEEHWPPGYLNTEVYRSIWGEALGELGRYDEAEAVLREAVKNLSDATGADSPRTQEARDRLQQVLDRRANR